MTLDNAIKIRTAVVKGQSTFCAADEQEADLLGIEALKEVARARRLGPPLKDWLLPGETEEPEVIFMDKKIVDARVEKINAPVKYKPLPGETEE